LTKFDKFLKENDAKRTRALKKTLEERKLRESKEIEAGTLRESVAVLTTRKDRQTKSVETSTSPSLIQKI
jgi:hypothetical protein